jgi:hypothetical protein
MNKIGNLAAICVCLSLLAGGLSYLVNADRSIPFPESFLEEYIEAIGVTNSRPQNIAYKTTLLALVTLAAGGLLVLVNRHSPIVLERQPVVFQITAAVALYVCTLYPGILGIPTALFGNSSGLLRAQLLVVLSIMLVCAVGFVRRFAIPPERQRYYLWASLALYAFVVFAPGLLSPLVIPASEQTGIDWHYDSLLGPSNKISAGFQAAGIASATYGVLWVTLLGFWEKFIGHLNFGEFIRIVQWSQVAFFALVVLCFRFWRPTRILALFACLMLLAPFVAPELRITGYPNQTGFRSLGIPLGVLAMILARNSPLAMSSAILGLCWGALFLINFETSVFVGLGYTIYLCLRSWNETPATCNATESLMSFLRATFSISPRLFIAGFVLFACAALVIGLFALLYRSGFGAWPDILSPYGVLLGLGTAGYFGLPFYLDPWALVMYVCAAWILVSRGYLCIAGRFTASSGIEAALAAMLLVWLQYYVNRPHPWQLWTHLFLFGLMMSAYIDSRWIGLMFRRKYLFSALPAVSLIAFMVFPGILSNLAEANPKKFLRTLASAAFSRAGSQTEFSGVIMQPTLAEKHLALSSVLRERAASGASTHHIASSPFLLAVEFGPSSLASVNFLNFCSVERLNKFVGETMEQGPEAILIEMSSDLGQSSNADIFWHQVVRRIKDGLAESYTFVEVRGGWEVWRKN